MVIGYALNLVKKKERTALADGVIVEQDGNRTSIRDMRQELKRMGIKVD